jgi:serine/threonine protein kinase
VLEREESSRYDPRTREFYRLAVASRRRVWTPPYAFFGSNQTGVTRAQALFDPASPGQVQAVLTVDFDVHALSAAMAHPALPGARTLLYTSDGTVLAYPEGASTIARLPARSDHLLNHRDLGDPVIDAVFARLPSPLSPAGIFAEIPVVTGDTALAMAVPVPEFPDLGWGVAAIVPGRVFFRARIQHERQSLVVAAISLVAALAVAVIFSRHIVRVRRDAAAARVVAEQATERARDLGSYRLLERLGQGAMGEVWRAEHRLLARQAAIKLIREGTVAAAHLPPGELRARFRREARTLAALRSRHTIQIYDYGVTEDDTFFFVMELLDGVDLQTLVERHGPLPAGRVIHLMLQVCSSLAEAHDAGLVHRDIKPANLFVCRAADEVDVIKVLDFGLVQAARESGPRPDIQRILAASAAGASATVDDPRLTGAGQHLGTPAYMAPEQVRGEQIDGRADLYALACVAVWLLAGRTLFKGPTAIATMAAQLLTPIPDLAALVPGTLPPALDRILRQCLAKAPAERPPHAHALAGALRSIELPAGDAWTPAQARTWWADRFR